MGPGGHGTGAGVGVGVWGSGFPEPLSIIDFLEVTISVLGVCIF